MSLVKNTVIGSGAGYHTEMAQLFANAVCYNPETFTGNELKRMRAAYHAIVIDLLERVEASYEDKRKFVVEVNSVGKVVVEAASEEEARSRVLHSIDTCREVKVKVLKGQ